MDCEYRDVDFEKTSNIFSFTHKEVSNNTIVKPWFIDTCKFLTPIHTTICLLDKNFTTDKNLTSRILAQIEYLARESKEINYYPFNCYRTVQLNQTSR